MTDTIQTHNSSGQVSAILACPFCGGEAFLHDPDDFAYVACNECINQTTHFRNGKDVVIQRWNTRHESTELADLRTKLAAARSRVAEYEAAERLKSLMYSEWNTAVDSFALAMKKKLSAKAAEGLSGWDDSFYKDVIEEKLYKHVERQKQGGRQLIDIANLAMMLWNFEQKAEALAIIDAEVAK